MELEVLENIGYTQENGLVLCSGEAETKHISEWYHIFDKARKLEVDAVLFRRYFDAENNHINSKPSVYIFQKKDSFFNNQEHKDLHAKIWSAGEIDVYIILGKTRLDIVNARRPAEPKNDEDLSLENLKLASESVEFFNDQRFSAHIFGKGMFWEQGSWELDEKQTPFYILLDQLEKTRKNLHTIDMSVGQKKALDKLLLLCILIMFLEEKKSKKEGEESVFALKKKFEEYEVHSFVEILKSRNNGELCVKFLKELANKYNGKIFDILTSEEENFIKTQNLFEIAQFVLGTIDIETKQISIWRKYDFDFIPIELISSIYENFLQSETKNQSKEKEKGVVYTPPFLVNFLIDEVMPLNLPKENYLEDDKISYKVLDPACGSGIFLVVAYKRLLDWWLINNYENVDYLKEAQISDTFKQILEDNIFGVDVNETATQISIFSLTIAFLDKIDPKLLWGDFQFKNLSAKNIKDENFFEWAVTAPKDFDLVIGNPPFNGGNNQSSVKIADDLINKIGFKHKKVPGNKFALQFFEGAMAISNNTCLIIPSNVLLYNQAKTSHKYRKSLFTDFTIDKIFDFTHLRRVLFGSADTAVCAIIAQNKPSEQQNIEHTIIKRLTSTEKKIAFEIDNYDLHFVRWDWAIDKTKQFVWKTNLLGGGRLFHLINRFSGLRTFVDFIKTKKEWKEERGFEGGNKIRIENAVRIVSIKENGEVEVKKNATILTNKLKDSFMYEPPFIIFDQVLGTNNLPISIIKKNNQITQESSLFFNRDFVGISVPESDEEFLENNIYKFIRFPKKDYLDNRLFILATSFSAMILTETDINKSEILKIPFPENKENLKLSDNEIIIQKDVLDYYIHLGKGIQEGKGKILNQIVTFDQLKNYGEVFCKVVNSIYEDKDEQGKISQTYQIGKVEQTPNFTFYQFIYGAIKPESENFNFKKVNFSELDNVFKNLIENKEENRSAIYTRVVRLYDYINGYDCVFFVKPNAMRYWLDSIALRDADDTIYDYYKAGY